MKYNDYSLEERAILRKCFLQRALKGKMSIKKISDFNDMINEDRWEKLYGGDE